jgi:outer membrane protein TolC
VSPAAEPPQGEASKTLEETLRVMMIGGGLTSDTVVARALQNSNEIKAKQQAIDAADWGLSQAKAAYYPQLMLSARYTRYSHINPVIFGAGTVVTTHTPTTGERPIPAGEQLYAVNSPGFGFPIFENSYSLSATLNIPLSDYVLRVSNAAGAAGAAKSATELEEKSTRAAVALDARVAYYQWIRAQGTQIVATGALAQSQGHLSDTQNAFAAGLVSKADVLRAQSQEKSAELFLERSRGNVELSTEKLRSLMQDFSTPRFEVGENIIADLPPGNWPNFDAAYSEAIAQRPELQSLRQMERSAHDQASLARKADLPRLDAQAGAQYANPNPRYLPPEDKFHGTWDVGVVLSWTPTNIFGAEAGAHVAEANAAEFAAQQSALKEALRLEIAHDLQAVKEEEFALTATAEGLTAAEEGYRVRRELFRIGRATLVEVTDAENELTRARLESVNAHIDYRIARAQLAHALGRKP